MKRILFSTALLGAAAAALPALAGSATPERGPAQGGYSVEVGSGAIPGSPSAAQAGENRLFVRGTARRDVFTISRSTNGRFIIIVGNRRGTASGPCENLTRRKVQCNAEGVDGIGVFLFRGQDKVRFSTNLDIPGGADGGPGRDRLIGGNDGDFLDGAAGRDNLIGRGGDDFLRGGPGNDVLRGGPGNDILRGGPGRDDLRGGAGNNEIRQD